MLDDAVAWAGAAVGKPITAVAELSGGLTSTMLALTDASGRQAVLRLMTEEPWRVHGAELTRRERRAQLVLADTPVPAPSSIALDADGEAAGVAAHLMSRLPGTPRHDVGDAEIQAMAAMLASIHAVRPAEPFRDYQSWAWEAKWVVPAWSAHPASWRRAFEVLATEPPAYVPTLLHRDFSHRNLLWTAGRISGVVDWVETSTGPAWLDAAHAATNLALDVGSGAATAFLEQYAALAPEPRHDHWLLMDAVGFLPAAGREPHFGSPVQLERLDTWLDQVVGGLPG